MSFEFRELTETSARFVITDVDPSFVNALRRTLISDVPKMAIETVEFHLGHITDEETKEEYESVTPLFDEIIAHRLGLIPIPTDLELYEFRDRCKCKGEGCPTCTIMYSLNKKGPCTVYSGDLEPVRGDKTLKIKDDKIPIVKLGKGQAVLIYATAILGTGKEHAKWCPVHGVGYSYYPIIKLDKKKCDSIGECITVCPQAVFEKDKDGKITIIESRIENCNLCMSCVEKCSSGALTVKGDESKIIFTFETDGSVSASAALKYALKTLASKMDEFRKKVEALD